MLCPVDGGNYINYQQIHKLERCLLKKTVSGRQDNINGIFSEKVQERPLRLKKKGNENQFRHLENVLLKMKEAADALNQESIAVAKEKIKKVQIL